MAAARRKHKVLVLCDSAGTPPPDQDFSRELKTEDWAAEAHVIDALKRLGHEVRMLGVYEDPSLIIDEVKAHPPDVVFNLTEHFNDRSAHDRNVAGLLEMLDVCHTGSGPIGLTLCKNKGMAKEILAYHRIRVPDAAVFPPGSATVRFRIRSGGRTFDAAAGRRLPPELVIDAARALATLAVPCSTRGRFGRHSRSCLRSHRRHAAQRQRAGAAGAPG